MSPPLELRVPLPGPVWGAYPERREPPRVRWPWGRAPYRSQLQAVRAAGPGWRALSEVAFVARVRAVQARIGRDGLSAERIVEALAAAVEAARRSLGLAAYDGQIKAALVMLDCRLAEMATGEGKTLSAALAAAVGALAGMPVHVLTANDYLVERVPETESQGRVHTSACTVAVLPEVPEAEQVEINPSELKIDTFRASGAGGQHVNKTDSAIRITHLPTGLVVECQDERSQHKNRAKAMSVLSARLQAAEDERHRAAEQSTRRNLVGSGDRSERIRTYNYPQGRLSEHRINLTLYRLGDILEGDLDCVITPLVQEYQADQLASLAESN